MRTAAEFPAFIKLEHKPTSAGATLLAEINSTLDTAERRFQRFSGEAQRQLDQALSVKRNQFGSLDLGVDQLRASAVALQARATAAREVASAMALAKQEEGDYSRNASLAVKAAQALAIEEERAAAAAMAQAQAAEQVQQRLNRQASAVDMVTSATHRNAAANDNATRGVSAQRTAFIQLGQQMQDVVVQAQMGARGMTIFTQQVPQMAFALSGLADSSNKTFRTIGKFGEYLSGPFGAAFFAATAIMGPFIANMLMSGDATDDTGSAMDKLADKLDLTKNSYESLMAVVDEYNSKQNSSIALTYSAIIATEKLAKAKLDEAKAIATSLAAQIKEGPTGPFGQGQYSASLALNVVDSRIAKLEKDLASAGVAAGTERVKRQSDKRYDIEISYNEQIATLEEKRKKNLIDQVGYEKQRLKLVEGQKKALDAYDEAHKKGRKKTSATDKEAAAAKRLADFGDRAAEHIQRVNERFNEQPKLIDQANAALRDMDATIKDLEERKPIGWEQMVKDAQAAKTVIVDSLSKPFEDLEKASERRLTIERLLAKGREDEAAATQIIWSLEDKLETVDDKRRQAIIDMVRNERLITEELRARQDVIGYYLDATRSIRQNLVSIFSGESADFGKIFKQLQAQVTVERLFGPALRQVDDWIKGQSGLGKSVDYMAGETKRAGEAAGTLAQALGDAAAKISGTPTTGAAAANDKAPGAGLENNDPNTLTVYGSKDHLPTVVELAMQSAKAIYSPITDELNKLLGAKLGGKLGDAIVGAQAGVWTGGATGGILGALQGIAGSNSKIGALLGKGMEGASTGTMVAGLGNALGIKMSETGAQIGGAIGSVIPIPGGQIIGSVIGGFLGGLFGKRPRGAAEVSNSSVYGHTNDAALTDSINTWGGQVQDAVNQIAGALGATVGNYSIGLGRYKEYYQVSSVAGDPRLGNSYFRNKSANAVYDGTDAEAAMAAAIGAALAQGAIKGISAASQRILQSGKDLQKAIEKAVLIESIPKRLRELTDPVGAAIDTLNREFQTMIDALKEGGATAEQFAQAQQLYDLERARAIEQATASLTGSLRSLLDDLTIGNDALSLSDRRAAALAAYQPLAARVAAGDTTAYNDFADAARSLLDIQRQMFGSQTPFFDLAYEIKGIAQTALDSQQALIDAATSSNSPFAGNATSAANDNQGVVDAIGQSNYLLATINENLSRIGQTITAGSAGNLANFLVGGVSYF